MFSAKQLKNEMFSDKHLIFVKRKEMFQKHMFSAKH